MEKDKKGFSRQEALDHYKKVASGEKSTKRSEKFTASEQRAYARGRVDENNQAKRDFAYRKASAADRKKYEVEQARKRQLYKDKNKSNTIFL
ncbi:MAG: hypothetical protein LBU60_05165 [Clostridiales bacterium]|jgi:hypothetical protein|nr:hypothetical protein [Clostridiales bacterium]